MDTKVADGFGEQHWQQWPSAADCLWQVSNQVYTYTFYLKLDLNDGVTDYLFIPFYQMTDIIHPFVGSCVRPCGHATMWPTLNLSDSCLFGIQFVMYSIQPSNHPFRVFPLIRGNSFVCELCDANVISSELVPSRLNSSRLVLVYVFFVEIKMKSFQIIFKKNLQHLRLKRVVDL